MVLVNTGLRRAIGAGINKGLSFFAPLKTQITLARGTGSPTYTRATTAYVTDFENLQRQVPSGCARFTGARMVRNMLTLGNKNSEDLTGWNNPGNRMTITADAATTPSGAKASFLTPANTNNPMIYSGGVIENSAKWLTSFHVKLSTPSATNKYCRLGLLDGSGNAASINLATQAVTYLGAGCSCTVTSVGDGWYLIELVEETTFSGGSYLGTICCWNTDDPGTATATVDGTGFYVGEVQIEVVAGVTSPMRLEYVSNKVLSAPYHGAGVDGVKYFSTDRSGAPISDATLDGYLVEGSRQNRCLYSQDFTNAAWVSGGGGIAVTPNTAIAPDGTTTADTLTASGANGTLIQDLGVVASAAKAGGLYLKRKTGTGNIDLTLDGGATWTTVAVTSSWLPLEKTQTLADEDFGIRIVTSGDEVYAWQGQVETAAFISSVIPTTTAAVTRNLDVLTYPSAGNISNESGTCYAESKLKIVNCYIVSTATNIASGSPITIGGSQTSLTDSVSGRFFNTNPTVPASVISKFVTRWNAATPESCGALDGVLGTSRTYSGTIVRAPILIGIDNSFGSGEAYTGIRNVKIWTTAKTDAQLQALTT